MTATITRPQSPAIEQAKRLAVAFEVFNDELFSGVLPPVMLQLRNKPGSYGYFQPRKWSSKRGDELDVISLDSATAAERPLIELLSTLVHEMCHQAEFERQERQATGGHGKGWRALMHAVGLPPVQIGSTWRQATHRIEPGGPFDLAFQKNRQILEALPWQECIRSATRGRGVDKVKFQCPECGSNAWARGAAELLCGTCSTPKRLVVMIPEFRPEGGGGKGSGKAATAKREHYPEPTTTPGLPVWTDELSRELRLHTGIDHPPTDKEEALIVVLFGVAERKPELHQLLKSQLESGSGFGDALKQIYRHRCQVLHPDAGGSEVAFKALQVAYRILQGVRP